MRTPLGAAAALSLALAAPALAQDTTPAVQPLGVWPLFMQSFDLFTVVLLLGSLTAGALIFRCIIEVRGAAILQPRRADERPDPVRLEARGSLRSVHGGRVTRPHDEGYAG